MQVETNKIKLKKANMHCYNKNSLAQEIPSIKTYKMHSSKNHDQKYFNQKKQPIPETTQEIPMTIQTEDKANQTKRKKNQMYLNKHLFINEDL